MNKDFELLKKDFLERTGKGATLDFLRDSYIYESPLFAFLKKMPKGAELHAHADAILPIREQVQFLLDHPELVIATDGPLRGQIRYAGDGPRMGCKTMKECLESGWTIEDFRHSWTIMGAVQGSYLWDYFEGIFTKCGAICTTPELVEDYYIRVMNHLHSIGVEHLELRCPFFGTREDAMKRGEAFVRALQKVRETDPVFTLRIVACAGKNDIWDPQFDTLMDNAMFVRENLKDPDRENRDMVVAIDIVNDEDSSYSLARYEDRVRSIVASHPGLKLTLHAGESLRGENAEIAIALRCGIDRLGHGFNLYRYPDLFMEVREKGIPIEVCPVSNRALGYCEDFAKHPASTYRASGIPLVICSDDPAYQADEILVGDYLAVAVGWDLTLDEVRSLSRNSIEYSFLAPEDKAVLLHDWERRWEEFVN